MSQPEEDGDDYNSFLVDLDKFVGDIDYGKLLADISRQVQLYHGPTMAALEGLGRRHDRIDERLSGLSEKFRELEKLLTQLQLQAAAARKADLHEAVGRIQNWLIGLGLLWLVATAINKWWL